MQGVLVIVNRRYEMIAYEYFQENWQLNSRNYTLVLSNTREKVRVKFASFQQMVQDCIIRELSTSSVDKDNLLWIELAVMAMLNTDQTPNCPRIDPVYVEIA